MEHPLHVKLLEERGERNQFKILESQKEGFLFFADIVALGFHSTKVQEHTCVLISSPNRTTYLREEHSQVHESNDGSIVSFELRTHIGSQQHAIQQECSS